MNHNYLAAKCVNCGGDVQVTLAAGDVHCTFCGSKNPLNESVARQLKSVQSDLERSKYRLTLKNRKIFTLAGEFSSMSLIAAIGAYGIIIAIIVGMVFSIEGARDLFADGFFPFLTKSHPGAEGFTFTTASSFWWMIFLAITILSLNILTNQLFLIRLKKMSSAGLALPPLLADQEPRCRACGGALGKSGMIRQCDYCGTDNVVSGNLYKKYKNDIRAQLDQFSREIHTDIQKMAKSSEKLQTWFMALPILFAFFFPLLAPLFPDTVPRLWIIPGLLFLTDLAVVLYSRTLRVVSHKRK